MKSPFREQFAQKIIRLRKDKDLTQKELSNKLEINPRTYAAYEERRSEPSLIVLKRIALFYGMSLDQLVDIGQKV